MVTHPLKLNGANWTRLETKMIQIDTGVLHRKEMILYIIIFSYF